MTTTVNHNLDLIADGDQPWGQRMRDNLTTIDARLPNVEATLWAIDNNQSTTITTQGVPVKANIPNTAGVSPNGLVTFSANRITFTGTPRSVLVVATFVIVAAANNKDFRLYLGHNGGFHTYASAKVRGAQTNSYTSDALAGVVSINTGDFIELWVANLTDATAVTVVDLSMAVHG